MHSASNKLPLLYSFRRCPYAIRARMVLLVCGQAVRIREVRLRDKPAALRALSKAATVPVLQLPNGTVLTESLDIMRWAALESGLQQTLAIDDPQVVELIRANDEDFKPWLDRYKYFDRHPSHSQSYYRDRSACLLDLLEDRLAEQQWLLISGPTLADYAILPFVRQFAAVDRVWFDQSGYRRVREWLGACLQMPAFAQVMEKYPFWQPGLIEPVLVCDV